MSFTRTLLRTRLPLLRLGVQPLTKIASSPPILSLRHATATTRPLTSTSLLLSRNNTTMTYDELKPYTLSPTGNLTLIDVREPNEVAEGMIPSAVNVPLSVFKEAFKPQRESDDFQRSFAFKRPRFDDDIVVYCRSGKRSAQAADVLVKQGWKNVRNYQGSYLDWVQQEQHNKNQDDD